MEFQDNLSESVFLSARRYRHNTFFPVNRHMFDNQVREVLTRNYGVMEITHMVEPADSTESQRQVEYALYRFRELVEMLNTEIRYCQATLNSLVYPDIYLLVTGRQDVQRALENIQNRLEIYVAE